MEEIKTERERHGDGGREFFSDFTMLLCFFDMCRGQSPCGLYELVPFHSLTDVEEDVRRRIDSPQAHVSKY